MNCALFLHTICVMETRTILLIVLHILSLISHPDQCMQAYIVYMNSTVYAHAISPLFSHHLSLRIWNSDIPLSDNTPGGFDLNFRCIPSLYVFITGPEE